MLILAENEQKGKHVLDLTKFMSQIVVHQFCTYNILLIIFFAVASYQSEYEKTRKLHLKYRQRTISQFLYKLKQILCLSWFALI